MVKTINILPEKRRDQWHMVVYMLRRTGTSLTQKGIDDFCDELDRYIDMMEDCIEKIEAREE